MDKNIMESLKYKQIMSKNEVVLLINLIRSNPILTSKETNASTNKLKKDAWTTLTSAFNARSRSVPKTKVQLQLKWDNLKKAARKRAHQIRMNRLKTDGDKRDFTFQDKILEKVTQLLVPTSNSLDANILEGQVYIEHASNNGKINNLNTECRLSHHIAIERYYNLKREKVELEIKLLKIQLAKAEAEHNNIL